MRSKLLLFFVAFSSISLAGQSQTVFFINAGSRASWGTHQELLIDNKGDCRYYVREVNGTNKDSSRFNISVQTLDSIFKKAEQVGFFNLDKKYESGHVDGSGIYISMNYSGRKHNVHLLNIDVPAITEIVTLLNNILSRYNIRIYYGQPFPK